ncbi:unnamed protein product, partial [Prorocentrum cordatum]
EAAHERTHIQMLSREALQLREACCLPARLKRETSFLVKVLNQDGATAASAWPRYGPKDAEYLERYGPKDADVAFDASAAIGPGPTVTYKKRPFGILRYQPGNGMKGAMAMEVMPVSRYPGDPQGQAFSAGVSGGMVVKSIVGAEVLTEDFGKIMDRPDDEVADPRFSKSTALALVVYATVPGYVYAGAEMKADGHEHELREYAYVDWPAAAPGRHRGYRCRDQRRQHFHDDCHDRGYDGDVPSHDQALPHFHANYHTLHCGYDQGHDRCHDHDNDQRRLHCHVDYHVRGYDAYDPSRDHEYSHCHANYHDLDHNHDLGHDHYRDHVHDQRRLHYHAGYHDRGYDAHDPSHDHVYSHCHANYHDLHYDHDQGHGREHSYGDE